MRVEIGAQMLNFVSYNDDRTNQSELMEHRLNSSKFIVVYSVQLPRNDGSLGAYNEWKHINFFLGTPNLFIEKPIRRFIMQDCVNQWCLNGNRCATIKWESNYVRYPKSLCRIFVSTSHNPFVKRI